MSNLPGHADSDHPFDIYSGKSVTVIVRVEWFAHITTGRYFHRLDEWQIDGFHGAHKVLEWWPLPEIGTGNKPE